MHSHAGTVQTHTLFTSSTNTHSRSHPRQCKCRVDWWDNYFPPSSAHVVKYSITTSAGAIAANCMWYYCFWMLRRCFPALVSRQAVEGHRGRMREAVWVALWSDIFFFLLYLCTCVCTWCATWLWPLLHSSLVTAQTHYNEDTQSSRVLTYLYLFERQCSHVSSKEANGRINFDLKLDPCVNT